jgi:hypothetical protein
MVLCFSYSYILIKKTNKQTKKKLIRQNDSWWQGFSLKTMMLTSIVKGDDMKLLTAQRCVRVHSVPLAPESQTKTNQHSHVGF